MTSHHLPNLSFNASSDAITESAAEKLVQEHAYVVPLVDGSVSLFFDREDHARKIYRCYEVLRTDNLIPGERVQSHAAGDRQIHELHLSPRFKTELKYIRPVAEHVFDQPVAHERRLDAAMRLLRGDHTAEPTAGALLLDREALKEHLAQNAVLALVHHDRASVFFRTAEARDLVLPSIRSLSLGAIDGPLTQDHQGLHEIHLKHSFGYELQDSIPRARIVMGGVHVKPEKRVELAQNLMTLLERPAPAAEEIDTSATPVSASIIAGDIPPAANDDVAPLTATTPETHAHEDNGHEDNGFAKAEARRRRARTAPVAAPAAPPSPPMTADDFYDSFGYRFMTAREARFATRQQLLDAALATLQAPAPVSEADIVSWEAGQSFPGPQALAAVTTILIGGDKRISDKASAGAKFNALHAQSEIAGDDSFGKEMQQARIDLVKLQDASFTKKKFAGKINELQAAMVDGALADQLKAHGEKWLAAIEAGVIIPSPQETSLLLGALDARQPLAERGELETKLAAFHPRVAPQPEPVKELPVPAPRQRVLRTIVTAATPDAPVTAATPEPAKKTALPLEVALPADAPQRDKIRYQLKLLINPEGAPVTQLHETIGVSYMALSSILSIGFKNNPAKSGGFSQKTRQAVGHYLLAQEDGKAKVEQFHTLIRQLEQACQSTLQAESSPSL